MKWQWTYRGKTLSYPNGRWWEKESLIESEGYEINNLNIGKESQKEHMPTHVGI